MKPKAPKKKDSKPKTIGSGNYGRCDACGGAIMYPNAILCKCFDSYVMSLQNERIKKRD